MHSEQEYHALLKRIWYLARQMAICAASRNSSGIEVVKFLKRYGYEEYPSDKTGETRVGPWLYRPGLYLRPSPEVSIAIGIIPCFSDDVVLDVFKEDDRKGKSLGYFSQSDDCEGNELYSIVLPDADKWSYADLALRLLHEGNHGRHIVGPKVGLECLDDKDEMQREVNCWLLELDVLDMWGGKLWDIVVEREIQWLKKNYPDEGSQVEFHYWLELDQLFGVAQNERIQWHRIVKVFLRAYMKQVTRQGSAHTPYEIAYKLISQWYSKGNEEVP